MARLKRHFPSDGEPCSFVPMEYALGGLSDSGDCKLPFEVTGRLVDSEGVVLDMEGYQLTDSQFWKQYTGEEINDAKLRLAERMCAYTCGSDQGEICNSALPSLVRDLLDGSKIDEVASG